MPDETLSLAMLEQLEADQNAAAVAARQVGNIDAANAHSLVAADYRRRAKKLKMAPTMPTIEG